MWFPVLRGRVARRMLVNYRLDPDIAARCLPAPLRPKLAHGWAVAGVCLIRMCDLRPWFSPVPLLGSSENGALRFAVEWDVGDRTEQGVYIPERFTTSRLAAWAGQRMFPGKHSLATFRVEEEADRIHLAMDGPLTIDVTARPVERLEGSRLFAAVAEASEFFRLGACGYSEAGGAAGQRGCFDGVEFRFAAWRPEPLAVESVRCNYFDDAVRFPPGTAVFDNALLMREVRIEFHQVPSRRFAPGREAAAAVPV
jgi:hypothetical protein